MYRQQSTMPTGQTFTCPDCRSRRFRLTGSKLECTNCSFSIKSNHSNKFGAKKTEFNGRKYDSKYEASVAETLELRKKTKDIKDYDNQYRVEVWAHRPDGIPAFKVSHKVDFRIHHHDGSYELMEAKGVETPDYKMRRKFLEEIWLPMNPDHTYTVIKQSARRR